MIDMNAIKARCEAAKEICANKNMPNTAWVITLLECYQDIPALVAVHCERGHDRGTGFG